MQSSNNYRIKIYFALDESGKLSLKDVCTHFIIGGILYSDKNYVKSVIRKVELEIKKKYRINVNTEIKGSGFDESIIVEFINKVFDEAGSKIIPVFSVVVKKELNSNFTMSEPLAYNFLVDNLFHFHSKKFHFTRYVKEVSILMDQRNLKKDELNDLESLLKTNYIEKPYAITTYYMSSKSADVIRFSDLLDHVVYHLYNNPDGNKALYFKENIKPDYIHKIKKGIIFYPFKNSYFEELKRIKSIKIKGREEGKKIVKLLKEFSQSET